MYCSAGHAGKDDAIPFQHAPAPSHLKRAEVVKTIVRKWWQVCDKSFTWQISHLLFTSFSCSFCKSHSERELSVQQCLHLQSSMFFVPGIAYGSFLHVQFEHGCGAGSEWTRCGLWPEWQGVSFPLALLISSDAHPL